MDWSQCPAVDRHPDKLGGAWCFTGTRVPVSALFEHLDEGCTLEEFLEWFPSVTQEHIHGLLSFAQSTLEQPSAAA
jgi:uncharacterized protein (DUF433 family)